MKTFQFIISFVLFLSFIQNANSQTNVFTSAQQLEAASSESSQDNSTGISLGMKFQSSVNGQVTAIRFYKSISNIGTHTGQLWTSSGSLLGTVTFTSETASGWQQATLQTPIAIVAGQTYIVSYHSSQGFYNRSLSYFNTTSNNGSLTAISNSTSQNGLYLYTTTPALPTNSFSATNYWVDIVFTTASGDVTPPFVTATSPGAGTNGASISTPITIQVNEALQPASVSSSSISLMNGMNAVPFNVSYTSGSQNITLTPVSELIPGTTYSVIIKGGTASDKILDLAGNPLSSDYSWSFTTQSSVGSSTSWTVNGNNIVNTNTGFVGIATTINPTPGDASLKLAVNGNIYAKKLKISQQGWADYVFDSSYVLRPISELEEYIRINKRLPELPSADDVAQNGTDLGDTQVLLLKKIEELTLYVIELKREIDTLKLKQTKKANKK